MFYLRTEKVKINRKQNKKKNADIKIVIAQVRNPDVSKVAVSIKFHFKAPDSERENGQMSVNKWHQRWRKNYFYIYPLLRKETVRSANHSQTIE